VKKIRVRWHELTTYNQQFEVPDDFDPEAAGVDLGEFVHERADYSKVEEVLEREVLEVQDLAHTQYFQPSAALQAKVQSVIEGLSTETERIETTVYWQDGQALVLVPGETGYREQQAIFVYEPDYPYGDTMSAIVGEWSTGVRDTRVG
jgi:hypothetical protein